MPRGIRTGNERSVFFEDLLGLRCVFIGMPVASRPAAAISSVLVEHGSIIKYPTLAQLKKGLALLQAQLAALSEAA